MNADKDATGRPETPPSNIGALRRWLPLAVIVVAAFVVWYSGLTSYLSLESIAEHRNSLMDRVSANLGFALLVFAGIYIITIALSLPGGVFLTIIGGFLFGWLIGGVTAVVAATVGAGVVFLIARSALGEVLAARAGPWLEKLRGGFQEDAISYLLFLRLVPVFPFWLVNLAPALLGMRLGPYLLGTVVGIIPGTFAFAFAGAGLDSIIEAQQEAYMACLLKVEAAGGHGICKFTLDPGSLLTNEIIVAFVALGIVSLIPVALKRLRLRKNEPE